MSWKGTVTDLIFLFNYSLVVMKLVDCASFYSLGNLIWQDSIIYLFLLEVLNFSLCSIDVQAQGTYEMTFYIIVKNSRSLPMVMTRNVRILWTWVSRLWGKLTCLTCSPTEMLSRCPIVLFLFLTSPYKCYVENGSLPSWMLVAIYIYGGD